MALSNRQKEFTNSSPLKYYRDFIAGKNASYLDLIKIELYNFFLVNFPTLIGLTLRAFVVRILLKACGKRPIIGISCTFRSPKKISFGNKVAVDDYSLIDARGSSEIIIGDNCLIGRQNIILAKDCKIELHKGVNISSNCRIASESSIIIGEGTLIAAFCYIGPGNHEIGSISQPIITAPMIKSDGVRIGSNVWIGTNSTILDGVKIGDGAVIGAHSFVKDDIPNGAIAVGVPAKVIRFREGA